MKKIAVFDFETDPFKFGRVPRPFCWGFYDGDNYMHFWASVIRTRNMTDDIYRELLAKQCIKVLLELLEDTEHEYLIYAHNGGKFDFMFFIEYFSEHIKIVNGRILEARLGKHIFRDSYGILPIPLKASGGKKEIDYALMELEIREKHKQEILDYLKPDCVSLYELVIEFVKEFGDVLTIGGAAMREFKKFHKFETASRGFDSFFRQFYYGGRCQCFETGVIKTPIKIFDLNSAYPDQMARSRHPVSVRCDRGRKINQNTAFVSWQGKNYGAVPVRLKSGLNFNVEHSDRTENKAFFTTIHEFNIGLETGTIKPRSINYTIEFQEMMTFEDFVMHFYNSRQIAKNNGDKFHDIFYKLILNSSYGKFAQNPDGYQDSIILPWGEVPPIIKDPNGFPSPHQYEVEFRHDDYAIWSKPTERHSYYNVATAASITGAVRAVLLKGISNTVRPLYCDTDSIICNSLTGDLDDKKLGAWKMEGEGTHIAIAGKKLYAVYNDDTCIKFASKGVKLNPDEILRIAQGDVIEYHNPAPAFKLDGHHQFISRRVRKTTV